MLLTVEASYCRGEAACHMSSSKPWSCGDFLYLQTRQMMSLNRTTSENEFAGIKPYTFINQCTVTRQCGSTHFRVLEVAADMILRTWDYKILAHLSTPSKFQ